MLLLVYIIALLLPVFIVNAIIRTFIPSIILAIIPNSAFVFLYLEAYMLMFVALGIFSLAYILVNRAIER